MLKAYSDGDECHIPSRELGLEEDELHYVYVGKRRLVIVLGSCAQTWYPSEKEQIILLCAPVFSFKARQSQEFVLRSQAFDFPNLFYLPPDTDGCTSESAVRFEYIQPIMASCLHPQVGVLSRQPVALTDMARDLMLVHLSRFLGLGVAAPGTEAILADIKLYHDLLMEQLQKPTAK